MADQPARPIRAICYVDGFNLYHGLKEHSKARAYRWLNLKSFAESRLLPGHTLERVVYFTSIPPWNPGKQRRHETYIAALESLGVEVVRGRFQHEQRECYGSCGEFFDIYTEKLTDVHISTRMLRDAVTDRFDAAYLVSGDADQAPTIRALRELTPTKNVLVLLPPRRNSTELANVATQCVGPLSHRAFKHHVFPDQIVVGNRIIEKPDTW